MPPHIPIQVIVAFSEEEFRNHISNMMKTEFKPISQAKTWSELYPAGRNSQDRTLIITDIRLPETSSNPIGSGTFLDSQRISGIRPNSRIYQRAILVLAQAQPLSQSPWEDIKSAGLYGIREEDCPTGNNRREFLLSLAKLTCQDMYPARERDTMRKALYKDDRVLQGNALEIVVHRILSQSFGGLLPRPTVTRNFRVVSKKFKKTISQLDVVINAPDNALNNNYILVECKNELRQIPTRYLHLLNSKMGIFARQHPVCKRGILVSLGGFQPFCAEISAISERNILCIGKEQLKELIMKERNERHRLLGDWQDNLTGIRKNILYIGG